MMDLLDRNESSLDNIKFSDECTRTFTLNGEVNRQNCRYRAAAKSHWMHENHTQSLEKVNVWAGILDRVLGPTFIDGNLTGEKYRNLLRDELVPALAALCPDPQDPDISRNTLWIQQDGAPAYYSLCIRRNLNKVFSNRWMGRISSFGVFKTKPRNLNDLKERIRTEIGNITPETLNNVIQGHYK
jgi:hypothetical protein